MNKLVDIISVRFLYEAMRTIDNISRSKYNIRVFSLEITIEINPLLLRRG